MSDQPINAPGSNTKVDDMAQGVIAQDQAMVTRLVIAAAEVIRRDGVVRFTLDAVAQNAGVSKGALTHHFPTKNSLASKVLRDALAEFDELIDQHEAGDERAGHWTRAYLRATFDTLYCGFGKGLAPLLVPTSRAQELHDILNDADQRWRCKMADDGLPLHIVQIVCRAADGCWWGETADLQMFADAEQRQAFIDYLIGLTMTGV